MSCNCCHPSGCSPEKKKNEYIPAIISFTMLTVGMILNHFNLFTLPGSALIWYTVAYLPVGWPVLREAFGRLRHGEFFNEFMLMGIATIGAFCIGEYPEGVAVMLFHRRSFSGSCSGECTAKYQSTARCSSGNSNSHP